MSKKKLYKKKASAKKHGTPYKVKGGYHVSRKHKKTRKRR